MKIETSKIVGFLISTIISIIIFIIMINANNEPSYIFCVEAFVLLNVFINILINAKDRFFPLSFFLLTIFLGFLDIVFVVYDIRTVTYKYSIDVYEKSLLLFIFWIFAFLFAYFLKSKSENKKKHLKNDIIDSILSITNLNYLNIISIVIQFFVGFKILSTIYLIGDISKAMNDFAVFRYNNQGYLALLFPLLSLVSITFYEKKCKKLCILSMIINFLLITITGRRGLAINTVIIPLLVYYNYKVKKIGNKTIFFVMIPIICFVMIVGGIRNQQINYNSNSILARTLTYLTNTIQYGQNIPDMIYKMDSGAVKFQGNKYLFNGILGMIPRAIWKDKPETDNSLITSKEIYYSDITYGKPVGAFGFAYFCYGYTGVILSGLICGFLSCSLYKWMLERKNILSILIYSILIQSFIYITNPDSQTKIITLFLIFIIISLMTSIRNGKIIISKERQKI